jgi:hypothetical protein
MRLSVVRQVDSRNNPKGGSQDRGRSTLYFGEEKMALSLSGWPNLILAVAGFD